MVISASPPRGSSHSITPKSELLNVPCYCGAAIVRCANSLDLRALGDWLDRAHSTGSEKGRPMALDTTTFLIVLVTAIVLMGFLFGLRLNSANKKRS
jgi:hypothetical protein